MKADIMDYFSQHESLMDVGGLADYLVVSRDWIYKMVQKNSIPYVRTGSNIRFIKKQIDLWLEGEYYEAPVKNPVDRVLLAERAEDFQTNNIRSETNSSPRTL